MTMIKTELESLINVFSKTFLMAKRIALMACKRVKQQNISAFCRHKDELMNYIKDKVNIEIVDGGHRYAPPSIFP